MRDHEAYPDDYLRDILRRVRSVAVLGASGDPSRPSYGVAMFLIAKGYRVLAVSPRLGPDAVPGATVHPTVAAIGEPVDMVDVFRNNAAVEGVVDEVLALPVRPSVIWMQLGVRVDAAAARAEAAGIDVVMDRCPKIEYARLIGQARASPARHR